MANLIWNFAQQASRKDRRVSGPVVCPTAFDYSLGVPPHWLSEPHSGSTTIFVDELDAGDT